MTYTALAATAVVVVVGLDLVVLRTRLLCRRAFWVAYAIVFVFQLAANGVLTGRRVVRYAPGTILGTRFVYAPVEDLLFGFALVTATLVCWVAAGRRVTTRPASLSTANQQGRGRRES